MSKNYRIGLVMKSFNTDFFRTMHEGTIQYANDHSNLELICVGTDFKD